MRTEQELERVLQSYQGAECLYLQNIGYIAWHESTGNNYEILFLEANLGYGAAIYRAMMHHLEASKQRPYHSLFCYILGSNARAIRFYEKMGWNIVRLGQSIYRDDETVLAWVVWDEFIEQCRLY
jgi:ribosomal protein S18 acetylase RimI-like enzyme